MFYGSDCNKNATLYPVLHTRYFKDKHYSENSLFNIVEVLIFLATTTLKFIYILSV